MSYVTEKFILFVKDYWQPRIIDDCMEANIEIGIWDRDLRSYDFQGITRHDMIGVALRTTDIEMHGENFKEGKIPTC